MTFNVFEADVNEKKWEKFSVFIGLSIRVW